LYRPTIVLTPTLQEKRTRNKKYATEVKEKRKRNGRRWEARRGAEKRKRGAGKEIEKGRGGKERRKRREGRTNAKVVGKNRRKERPLAHR